MTITLQEMECLISDLTVNRDRFYSLLIKPALPNLSNFTWILYPSTQHPNRFVIYGKNQNVDIRISYNFNVSGPHEAQAEFYVSGEMKFRTPILNSFKSLSEAIYYHYHSKTVFNLSTDNLQFQP